MARELLYLWELNHRLGEMSIVHQFRDADGTLVDMPGIPKECRAEAVKLVALMNRHVGWPKYIVI